MDRSGGGRGRPCVRLVPTGRIAPAGYRIDITRITGIGSRWYASGPIAVPKGYCAIRYPPKPLMKNDILEGAGMTPLNITKSGQRPNFDTDLQILRAIAALLVVMDHSIQWMLIGMGATRADNALGFFADEMGAIGVGAFFALSGYIMLETNKRGLGSWSGALRFLIRRMLRIAPIYYVGSLAAFLLLTRTVGIRVTEMELLTSLGFVPYYSAIENPGFFPVLGVGWTLNLEMFFYLLFAGCLALFPPQKGALLLVAVICGVVVMGRGLAAIGMVGQHSILYFYSMHVMLLFAAGVLVSRFKNKIVAWAQPLARFLNFYLILAAMLAICLFFGFTVGKPDSLRKAFELSAIVLLVHAACFGIPMSGAARRLFVYLGDASYALYVFHSLFLMTIHHVWMRFGNGGHWAHFLLNVTIAIIGGVACYRLIEVPLRRGVEYPVRRWLEQRLPVRSLET
ncbi:acyltransferase [Sphingomonas sanguinis]|uniref:Acyltransferase n=1 Tax=Sphingomonas sanguinis TaxID=33051 RepID=A0ABU5LTS1_9SPHN|nr:acyltransferase [Sphingomonas sanguinis]MDZ7283338.1 acyltransferase [Sphingomonas sanguinis]